MSLQLLDLILIGTMLVSALLALSRGFTRETLSLIAWGAAGLAAAGAILSPDVMKIAKTYIQPEIVATVGVGAGVFLIVLIVTSLIGVKIADWVLDSAAGPFDRTLGFAYGLARGLLLVVVAYVFYIWLVPTDKRVGNAGRRCSGGWADSVSRASVGIRGAPASCLTATSTRGISATTTTPKAAAD